MLIVALPITGDYYTADLLSGSPRTTMLANQIDFLLHARNAGPTVGAALVCLLAAALILPMLWYLRLVGEAADDRDEAARVSAARDNPWGKARFLWVWTWSYLAWSLLPVVIAIRISFNSTRSLVEAQGWSLIWWWSHPTLSAWHRPELRSALFQSVRLASLTALIAVPLGVAFALALDRWRGPLPASANFLMALSWVMPELMIGVALFLVFSEFLTADPAGHRGPVDRVGDLRDDLSGDHRAGRLLSMGQRLRRGRDGPRGLARRCAMWRAVAADACCPRSWRRR